MVIKIAVVEDEETQAEYVRCKLQDYANEKSIRVALTCVKSAEEFLFKYTQAGVFDIIFLDICMTGMNGMELAKSIRKFDREVLIVFLTGVSDYVFEGYEIGAVRYLIKPVDDLKLEDTLNACIEEVKMRAGDFVTFKYLGENLKISRGDIIYIFVDGHYVKMITKTQTYEWKESLSNVFERLDKERFVMANRSSIVNLEYVCRITREECVLETGDKIPVSRGAYAPLNEAFIHFYELG